MRIDPTGLADLVYNKMGDYNQWSYSASDLLYDNYKGATSFVPFGGFAAKAGEFIGKNLGGSKYTNLDKISGHGVSNDTLHFLGSLGTFVSDSVKAFGTISKLDTVASIANLVKTNTYDKEKYSVEKAFEKSLAGGSGLFLTTEEDVDKDKLIGLIKYGEGMMTEMLKNGDVSLDYNDDKLDYDLNINNQEVYSNYKDIMFEGKLQILDDASSIEQ